MEKRYWFKRKTYGYGCAPATKEGYLVTLCFGVFYLIVSSLAIRIFSEFSMLSLTFICYKKGEHPDGNGEINQTNLRNKVLHLKGKYRFN